MVRHGSPKKNRILVGSFNLYTKFKQWSGALVRLDSAVSSAALKRYQDDSKTLFKNNFHDTYVTFSGKTNANQPHTHIFLLKNHVYILLMCVYNICY